MTDIPIRSTADLGIDQDLLAEVQDHTGATTSSEAINAALRITVEYFRDRRGRAYDRLQQLAHEEGFDFSAIEDAER